MNNHTMRQVTDAGVVTTVAGSPGISGAVDATGLAARFNTPMGAGVDSLGNVYIADAGNHIIRKVRSCDS